MGEPWKRKDVIGNCTLYLGDASDILHAIKMPHVAIIDPPYGVSGQLNSRTAKKGGKKNDYGTFTDSVEYVREHIVDVVERCVRLLGRVIVTPGNRCLTLYPEPDSFGAIMQPASVGLQPWGRADAQPILYYGKSPYGGKKLPGQRCSYVLTEAAQPNGHPCPKPINFWTQIVASVSLPGELVLDPFMGSGTTGVACVKSGRSFIGIEIDEGYFDIACDRIRKAYDQPDFFVASPEPKPEQLSILDAAE